MKQAEVIKQFESGRILTIGQFLFFKKEVVAYRDSKTGKPATFDKVEFAVLTANGVVLVQPDTRKIPDFDFAKFECPFKQMDKVVVEIDSMTVDKGVTTIGGKISKLE